MTRFILHIGVAKTGSTSIQTFLQQNREALAGQGLNFPRSPGDRNHLGLAAYCVSRPLDPTLAVGDYVAKQGFTDVKREFPERFLKELRASKADTVLLSNEHLHSLRLTVDEIEPLRDLLREVTEEVTVVVYLRRQDEVAISRNSTSVRLGELEQDHLEGLAPDDPFYNYQMLLDRWAGVFGRDRIVPRLFDREYLVDGDVVRDYAGLVGARLDDDIRIPDQQNMGLSASAHRFLSKLNEHMPRVRGKQRDRIRMVIANAMPQSFKGPGLLPPRNVAVDAVEMFRDSNEAVRQEWFPDRASLFSADFGKYPESLDEAEMTTDEAMQMCSELLRELIVKHRLA